MVTSHRLAVQRANLGICEEYSEDGQLAIFTVDSGDHGVIERWATAVENTLQNWPADRPCLILHDLHRSGVFCLDDLMRSKLERMFTLRPGLERYVALLMPHGAAANLADLFAHIRGLTVPISYPVHWQVFTSRKQAMIWLLSNAIIS